CGWGGGSNVPFGNGSTTGLPITANAVKSTTDGGDFYLMQLSPNAASLEYATFYGGNQTGSNPREHVDGGTSRFDRRGFVYQAVCGGCGSQNNFPVPPGAHTYSTTNPGPNCNNASFKFDFQVITPVAGANRTVCSSDVPFTLGGTPAGGIWSGNGVSLVNNQYVFTPSQATIGPNTLTYTIPNTGQCSRANSLVVTVNENKIHDFTLPAMVCVSSSPLSLQGTPAGGTFRVNGSAATTFNPATAGVGQHTITYTSNGTNGICGTVSKTIEVLTAPILQTGPDTLICPGSVTPFQLRASPAGGVWSGQHVSATGLFTPPPGFTGSTQATYTVVATCTSTATMQIAVAPEPAFQASLANGLCFSNPAITGYAPFTAAFANATTNATSFVWNFGDGNQSTETAPTHVYGQKGTYTVTLTATYGNGCQEIRPIATLVIEDNFLPNIITPNGDGLNDTFIQKFSCLPTAITIYNRWGKEVHHETIYQQTWSGGNLSEGTYFFMLKDEAGKTAKGWVEIVR
ncbi:MAG: PKD domain-containing protein, partial [Rufibacter sp.]